MRGVFPGRTNFAALVAQDDATPFAVNRATDQNQVHPGVAILGDLLLAVWQDEGSRTGEDESPSGVRARWLSVAPPD